MTQEEIEKVASQISFIETPDARERFLLRSGFKAGAKWRIDSVWHDSSEEPENVTNLLVLDYNGRPWVVRGDLDWERTVAIYYVEKWAYIEDLLPIKED